MSSDFLILRTIRLTLFFTTALLFIAPPARAATPAEITSAIEKAKAFLYKEQKPSGNWEKELNAQRRGSEHDIGGMQGDIFGGLTAIATYSLLASGEAPQQPQLGKAIRFLENADMIGIYAIGICANVWSLIPPARSRPLSDRDARLLMFGIQTGQDRTTNRGFWDYGNGRGVKLTGSSRFDHSVSQYGVLGLWACAENDIVVDRNIWEMIDAGWKSHQFPDGGWAYDSLPAEGRPETNAMTAAGVATLFITDDMLNSSRGLDCRGNISNPSIERGLAWITDHFKDIGPNTYTWYGIERIGAASGRKYLGANDWYAKGADEIVKSQRPDGSWIATFPGGFEPVATTSFALLFLTRGRAPLMINKLQYDLDPNADVIAEGRWNQRPRDAANLSRWTGKRLERTLKWQVVNLKAPASDLHEAPILYISGDEEIRFTPEDESKLQEFVESGGMILANADCGKSKTAFSVGFEKLGKRLFPHYDFRDVPSSHPIFTEQIYLATKWNTQPRLRGLSNGVRELMLLIPEADAARGWQMRSDQTQLPSFQLGADIFLYAVDKQNLNNRGESYMILPNEDIIADARARIANLVISSNPNPNPEPGGWRRLEALIHNQYRLDIEPVSIRLSDPRLSHFKLAHLTGTAAFSFTAAERRQLTDYIRHGGTLVVEAAGGNADFAESAVKELKSCFGAEAEEGLQSPLEPGSAVFHLSGADISTATFRDTYRRKVVGKLKTPRLNGITIGNRIAVFFSREDLIAGMVGEEVGGIAGYTPQSATEIMRNVVLYGAFGFGQAGGR